MRIEVEVWRQDGPRERGRFETHVVEDATPEMSLLELLDRLNDTLAEAEEEPIQFESDCREGACGACGVTVNDVPHGPFHAVNVPVVVAIHGPSGSVGAGGRSIVSGWPASHLDMSISGPFGPIFFGVWQSAHTPTVTR